jgi:anti-sigma regulatory factor (Ser/Thr protein kinase)
MTTACRRAMIVAAPGVPRDILAAAGVHAGLRVAMAGDDWAAGGVPGLLMAMDETGLAAGLESPYAGMYEYGHGLAAEPGEWLVAAVEQGGMAASVSTGTAYRFELAARFSAAFGRRRGMSKALTGRIELALQEAVANALVHGNLGVSSEPRGNAAGYAAYCAMISERLGRPDLSRRRVEIVARPVSGGVEISVADQGPGYDMEAELARIRQADAKAGRGLKIIATMARRVEAHDGGRRIAMVFV